MPQLIKEFDTLESSNENQSHEHEKTNWEFLGCGKVEETACPHCEDVPA